MLRNSSHKGGLIIMVFFNLSPFKFTAFQQKIMSWYRRSKLALDSLTSLGSKNPIRESISRARINHSDYLVPSLNKSRVSRSLGFQFGVKQNQCSQFVGVTRRYYSVDRQQNQHFKPRAPKRWFQNPMAMLIVVVVGLAIVDLVESGAHTTVYYGNLETIPYTKRKHLVLLSRTSEKQMGESRVEKIKATFKGKILPATHSESVRVRLIAKDIIEALQRGLRKEQVWSDPGYASDIDAGTHNRAHKTLAVLSESAEGKCAKEDDKWVQKSRKKGHERGSKSATGHLEGLNWEVLVVDEPFVNAFCLPGGKIVVFTGLLKHFRSDEEIATIIGHEVGHAVARHEAEGIMKDLWFTRIQGILCLFLTLNAVNTISNLFLRLPFARRVDADIATIIGHEVGHAVARHVAEGITKNLWFTVIQLILYQFVMFDVVSTMSKLFLWLPFTRRMEMEADHIGLLLVASAGYDPRVVPKVYEKQDQLLCVSALGEYISNHPSPKKRAKVLAQAKVMDEALAIYREVRSGRGVPEA